jgi:hypothetical protein
VFVAAGDITGDGVADIITGAGAGGGPHVKVFDGATGKVVASFLAYAPGFRGGVSVAAGDVNGDGVVDVITGAGAGGGPQVIVFDGAALRVGRATPLLSFLAYAPGFRGGVWVAAGDVNADGRADIITGAGAGGGPHVEVFSGRDGSLLQSFLAFDPSFTGGVRVGAIDANGDGLADIACGAGPDGGSHVRIERVNPFRELVGFTAFDPGFLGGIYVAG